MGETISILPSPNDSELGAEMALGVMEMGEVVSNGDIRWDVTLERTYG